MTALSTVEAALEALQAGRPVLVLDDEDRENEGDLVLAAETATEDWMAWTIRHSSGYLCAPMPDESPTGSSCRSWSPRTATRCAPPTRSRSTPPRV